jgi:hypothetical protein
MTDTLNTTPQAEIVTAPRQPWTTPALRPLDVSTSELGGGIIIDAEGHS